MVLSKKPMSLQDQPFQQAIYSLKLDKFRMKLISYAIKQQKKYGILTETGIIDLTRHFQEVDLKALIATQKVDEAKTYIQHRVDYKLEDVKLLPVIENPEKIICVGVNYDEHRVETKLDATVNPTIFFRVAQSQVAHEEPMMIPIESDFLDYEGEIAIVISKEGRRIPQDKAHAYIVGYACYNDGSIRDYQVHTTQWGPGKNFEATGAFGPWLVTKDEFREDEVLTIETRLNGERMQQADTTMLLFKIPKLIEYISTFTTLKPGDVIVTGTPGGVGTKRTPPVYMQDGDVVEIEVSKIGILRNPVRKEQLI
jgi:2-keto-4-pentenoate hydratase/2-oxohepta-3-ene-1,7-dioic acid hydratase in catechol pathway